VSEVSRPGFILGFGSTAGEEIPRAVRKLHNLLAAKGEALSATPDGCQNPRSHRLHAATVSEVPNLFPKLSLLLGVKTARTDPRPRE
jgi:hypothetical protein